MKTSIRSKKFTMGMVLFLVIILLLSVSSAYYLNSLSSKTSAILKENHYSVVYARDMSENLKNINQELTNGFLTKKNPDTLTISKEFKLFNKSLKSEKNNITEIGEDTLINIQKKYENLSQDLMVLSQMNEKAIEEKTDDAKISAQKFTLQMTLIGTLGFLIAYGYTFMFSSYFSERFYKMYNGIKEIVSSNYSQRLYLKGDDELSEISLIFNEMADKFNKFDQESFVSIEETQVNRKVGLSELQELKSVLEKMKTFEEQASELIAKFENKL